MFPKELSQAGLTSFLIIYTQGKKEDVSFKPFPIATPSLCCIFFSPILYYYLVFWISSKFFQGNMTIFKFLWRCTFSHFPSTFLLLTLKVIHSLVIIRKHSHPFSSLQCLCRSPQISILQSEISAFIVNQNSTILTKG